MQFELGCLLGVARYCFQLAAQIGCPIYIIRIYVLLDL